MQRPTRRNRSGRGRGLILAGAVGLGAAGVVAASVPGLGKSLGGLLGKQSNDIIPFKVQRIKLPVTVKERGNLESAKNEDVMNEVEGQTTIIFILPEGSRVKKGDKVCELDSASLRDQLTNQEITTRRAEADFQNALKTREVSEIAVKEYLEGTYPQEANNVEGEKTLAASELTRAEDRLKWTIEMVQKGYASESQRLADQQAKLKAQISFNNATDKAKVLQKYTRPREETELRANVEKAKSDELAKQATLNLEKSKEAKLRKHIDKCKLLAPNDGLVVYANDTNQFRGNNTPMIEEGATVRERQKIFSLPDISRMQVNTKVHESMVNLVAPGQRARIKVESTTGNLDGTVKSVAPLPDPSSFFASDIKMYTTLVTIDTQGMTNLRPGMTAEVEILITQLEDVIAVPMQAILEFKGKDHVFVLTPDGPKMREVKVGISNDKLIEIKEGLQAGEQVAMNPTSLLSEEDKRALSDPTSKDATKKDWGKAAPGTPTPKLSPGLAGPGAGGAPGAGGPPGADGKAKAKGKGGRGGFGNPAFREKFQKIPPEDMQRMRDASPEERKEILKKAGFTDQELEQMDQMRRQFQGGGGGGGPGGGGFGGGGGFRGGQGGPGGGGPPQ